MGFLKTAFRTWLGLSNEPMQDVSTPKQTLEVATKSNTLIARLNEFWLWFTADAKRLVSFYKTMTQTDAKRNYFYARCAYEDNKKTHSGIPKAVVDTIVNITGDPLFSVGALEESKQEQYQLLMEDIIEFNDFENIVKQDMRAKTLVIGGGVLIVSDLSEINPDFDKPVIEFIDERFCEIETVGNILVSVKRWTNYQEGNTKFTHFERRSYNKIENWLTKDDKGEVPLDRCKQTAHLEPEIILDIDMIPAVPVRYKNGHTGAFGQSIYEGKVDLFDDLDQTYSQISELVRKSTPKTYIPAELLEQDKNGNAILPNEYDIKTIMLKRRKNQDANDKITIDTPQLNYEGLLSVAVQQLIEILTGVLSPSSLGIEIQRNNNAEAMREKEKVTLITRSDIIDNEKTIVERTLQLAMRIYDRMKGRKYVDYDIHVDYSDFTSPTFEQVVQTMLPLWINNGISPEQFVKAVWEDTLTDEEREKEVAYLIEKAQAPVDMNFFGGVEEQEPVPEVTEDAVQ
jgi:hypothetical protein